MVDFRLMLFDTRFLRSFSKGMNEMVYDLKLYENKGIDRTCKSDGDGLTAWMVSRCLTELMLTQ